MSTTEETRKIVFEYLGAQAQGDGAKMAALLADDVQWTPPAAAGLGAPKGRDAVLAAMGGAGAKFFDLATMKVDVKWIVADGDRVVMRTHNACKAANGRDYSNEYVWVYRVADGRIVEIEEHVDSQRFKEIVID